jgi:[ribosomal protein S5]-alanine N-acetyltransferase
MSKNPGITLETQRLIIREFKKDDWRAAHEYGSDPEVVQFVPFGPNTEKDTRDFINRIIDQQKTQPRILYTLALVNKSEDRLIGSCELRITGPTEKTAEIGYVLNRQYWQQGYMTEAARAIIAFGFQQLGLHRIFATCYPVNTGSYGVMEKIGMHREGYLREYKLVKGAWRDCLLYSILETEFQNPLANAASTCHANPIEYLADPPDGWALVQPLWEKLRDHHTASSQYFKDYFSGVTWESRKKKLQDKTQDGLLHLNLAQDSRTGSYIAYCITSLDSEKQGEIESIFVERDYRKSGIGDALMTRALAWLDSVGAEKRAVSVAEGNENAFGFYRRYNLYPRLTILEQKQ